MTGLSYLITVDEETLVEIRAGLEDGKAGRVSDELSVVVVDDGLRNDIGTRREVNKSRRLGASVARARGTTVAVGDGILDRIGVIGRSISLGTVVLDVTVDLVPASAEWRLTLMRDLLVPVVRAGSRANDATGRRRSGASCRRSYA